MESFKPFGPSLGKGKLSKKFIKCINDKIDKSTVNKKNDYSSKLVSQIDNEIKLSNSFIKNNLSNELIKNIKKYLLKSRSDKVKEIKIINLWVVRQFKNEYNPVHYHGGHVSGAGFLKTPKTFGTYIQDKGEKEYVGGTLNLIHGSRQFMSNAKLKIEPKVGDFYFFPHYLMHTVYPFKGTDEERRSISFNGIIDEKIFKVHGNS